MTGSSSRCFPVPSFIKSSFGCLLGPDDDLDSILDQLDYCVDPYLEHSIWSQTDLETTVSVTPILDIKKYFPKLYKLDGEENKRRIISDSKCSNLRLSAGKSEGNLRDSSLSPISNISISGKKNSSFNKKKKRKKKRKRPIRNKSLIHSTVLGQPHETLSLIGETSVSDKSNILSPSPQGEVGKHSVSIANKSEISKKQLGSRLRNGKIREKLQGDQVGDVSLNNVLAGDKLPTKNLRSNRLAIKEKIKSNETMCSSSKKPKYVNMESDNTVVSELGVSPSLPDSKSENDLMFKEYDKASWMRQFELFLKANPDSTMKKN